MNSLRNFLLVGFVLEVRGIGGQLRELWVPFSLGLLRSLWAHTWKDALIPPGHCETLDAMMISRQVQGTVVESDAHDGDDTYGLSVFSGSACRGKYGRCYCP